MNKSRNIDKNKTFSEKPAVKTTIVGGRPPGSGKEADSIPRGIEILVKKASVDSGFKEILLKERALAANRINLSLEKTEVTMLNGIPQAQLEGIIAVTKVSPNMRQVFLGCTAAVMLAALTSTANAAEDDYRAVTQGISPDDINVRGIRPEIVEYDRPAEPYFRKAETDANLDIGILVVQVTERSGGAPLSGIKINFIKIGEQGISNAEPTQGLGYTNKVGLYRIEGVPVGKYKVKVSKGGKYFFQAKEVEILAKIENRIIFQLDSAEGVSTKGIRPDF